MNSKSEYIMALQNKIIDTSNNIIKGFDKKGTITNLLILKNSRDIYREKLGEKYLEAIAPFCQIIWKIMEANDINEFDAIAKIKNELPLYKQPGAELHFGCALYEIVEESRLLELEKGRS